MELIERDYYYKYDRDLGPTRKKRTRRYTTTYICTRSFKIIFLSVKKVRFEVLATRNVLFYEQNIILKRRVQIYVVVLRRERFLTRSHPRDLSYF